MDDHSDLLQAIDFIDPTRLDYAEWLSVGFGLHESGLPLEAWDSWSQRDPARYHEGECAAKWRDFGNGVGEHVGSGTIVEMAKRGGWVQPTAGPGEAIGWDDFGKAQPDPAWVDQEEAAESDKPATTQLYEYLSALFDGDDHVGYVTDSRESGGRRVPTKGHWDRTADELMRELATTDDLGQVLGDWDPDVGAWIRFNPLDGKGCGNANVTEYRYALVESDALDYDRQLPMIRAMNLPCAAIVTSGNKSVHAIVRIDADDDYKLYRQRVERLYAYCRAHGFQPDTQNKNPSRLSRLPGATRGGRTQTLVSCGEGAASWDEWEAWVEEMEDDLPDDESGDWDEPIRLKPPLIGRTEDDCILRQGQKMIVVGDSKMGKSYTLIDLAEAICVGGEWLGMSCARGKVYYVNLEIDPEEFRWRQHKVWKERPESFEPETKEVVNRNFLRWNLRGNATTLDVLAPRLIRRVLSHGAPGTFKAIIIDPIYKVNGGDDNDARAVAKFTNMLDHIIMKCGCSVIYAHHHPKGATGGRKSIDRMSGSGVYGRDADTIFDLSPLFVPEETWAKYDHKPVYRAEVSCRSFGHRDPIDCLFDWPRFARDFAGEFKGLKVLGEDQAAERQELAAIAREEQAVVTREYAIRLMRDAMAACAADGIDRNPTNAEVFAHMPKEVRSGAVKLGGKKVTLTRVKGWTKQSSAGFLGPFHSVNEGGVWGVIDDKSS